MAIVTDAVAIAGWGVKLQRNAGLVLSTRLSCTS